MTVLFWQNLCMRRDKKTKTWNWNINQRFLLKNKISYVSICTNRWPVGLGQSATSRLKILTLATSPTKTQNPKHLIYCIALCSVLFCSVEFLSHTDLEEGEGKTRFVKSLSFLLRSFLWYGRCELTNLKLLSLRQKSLSLGRNFKKNLFLLKDYHLWGSSTIQITLLKNTKNTKKQFWYLIQ